MYPVCVCVCVRVCVGVPMCVHTCLHMMQFEADRRAFIITVNSFGTELSGGERSALYPSCGTLHPEGLRMLSRAEDYEQVKAVADYYHVRLVITYSHLSHSSLWN